MEFAQTEKIEQMAQQIIERAQLLQQQKMQQQTQDRPVIVAIDGRCASGKTTLCSFIEQKTGYTVLHLDHFFLQPHSAHRSGWHSRAAMSITSASGSR